VAEGHDVTLFASGDSQTAARLIAGCPRALRLARCTDTLALHLAMVEQVARRAREFDVVHWHIDYLHFPVSRREHYHHVTTLHGRLDLADILPVFARFADLPVVSISDAQRTPLPDLAWQATVYHGFPEQLYRYEPRRGDYLAFLGRISPEKRVDRAIEIATALGWPLKIAAKVDRADTEYFEREIRPLLDHPLVDFIGEIGEAEKDAFLGAARALLFPIDWPEPFGLVMIESLACGTPVVAFRGGSVEEVVEEGVTGFVVDSLEEAIEATSRVETIDRRACRRAFEQRFSVRRMADDHVAQYGRAIEAYAGRAATAV